MLQRCVSVSRGSSINLLLQGQLMKSRDLTRCAMNSIIVTFLFQKTYKEV